ncbi:MAG: diguanylate cyclase [Myxococcaceae bacterium]
MAKKLVLGIGVPGLVIAIAGVLLLWSRADALVADSGATTAQLNAIFGQAVTSVIVFFLAIGVASFVTVHFFIGKPLRRLARLMRRAEEGDLVVRADDSPNDEIGQLSHAFNSMLQRLTSMKVNEIDTSRDLAAAHEELSLKKQLEVANESLNRRVSDLSLLYDVSRSLNATLQLPELLSQISQLVGDRLKVPKFSIMLLAEDGRLEVKSAYPLTEGVLGMTFELGHGACGRAAKSKKSVYLADLGADTEVYVRRKAGAPETGSLLSVPMIHKDAVLGVLNLERPDKAAFAPEEIELINAVADQAAIAVQNARLHEQTVALSITDPLTGAPNRRHLMTRLEMEIARANRFGTQLSVLMVDIDHFKQLNDLNGHRAGDDVLRQVCELMKASVRKVDLLARYGGEEFMIVLPQVTKDEGWEVAEKLRRAVEDLASDYGASQPLGKLTISVGLANLPVDATTQEDLVDCADSALYACKRAGRNKAIAYAQGMELHPGRERGPHAAKRRKTGEIPLASTGSGS